MSYTKKFLLSATCVAAFMCATAANATIVTVGNLSSDDATKITTDTRTGRQYTRFDVFNLNYENTLKAIAPGGAWAGWSIATAEVADAFIASALGVTATPCDGTVNYGTYCGTIADWKDGLLGASFDPNWDYFVYLNTQGGSGLMQFYQGQVNDYEQWAGLNGIDSWKQPGFNLDFLLYTDAPANAVPEPASLTLFGLAAAGVAAARRRKAKSA